MNTEKTIFYDINTQRDFIPPDGKFPIESADKLVPTWKALTDLAHEEKIRVVCCVDCHLPGDPQLKSWGGPYPDHCISGTPGQQKIVETATLNPMMLEHKKYTPEEIQKILDHPGEIVFKRQEFEHLAGNPHVSAILRLVLRPYTDIVFYGVYTEACVDREISTLVGIGPKLHIVTDAVAVVGEESPTFHEKLQQEGVDLLSFQDLKVQILN
ncbi:MAG TPA: cysteine hydrolase family protein [Candidatus Binatus sp.]|nr:cysteine hydrolase family protein [Candidatus Binatus sp.]